MKNFFRKNIPNAITCANLFSGCVGIVMAFRAELTYAAYAVFVAAIFDFLDGLAARALKSYSDIGKNLDSLADLVSFGVLPAAVVYQLFLMGHQLAGISAYLNFIAFLIPVFSALRLAKFNQDTRQAENFIGLPTPANALLIASLPFIMDSGPYRGFLLTPTVLAGFVLLMCTLLVMEVPMMSLKFKNLSVRQNIYRYLLLLISAILLLFFKFAAIPVIIFIYIGLSFIQFKSTKLYP